MTTTRNISLPETLKTFVDMTINTEGYGTASEYIRELIRADQKKKEQARLEQVLLQALSSGASKELTGPVWANLKAQVTAKLEKSGNKKR